MYLRCLSEGPRTAGPKNRRRDSQHDDTPGGGYVLNHCDASHLCVLRLLKWGERAYVCMYVCMYSLDDNNEEHCTRLWRTLRHRARTPPSRHLATR